MTIVKTLDAPGVLGEIVARKRMDLEKEGQCSPPLEPGERKEPVRNFEAAIRDGSLSLIAEYKRRSPSQGQLTSSRTVQEVAIVYNRYASAISVLCDGPYFDGGLHDLSAMRQVTHLPVLCKDFIISTEQVQSAYDAGADALLLMASLLPVDSLNILLHEAKRYGLHALVEVHSQDELYSVLDTSAQIIGINSRDLSTMKIDLDNVARLARHIPSHLACVAESGLHTQDDINLITPHADAALIGTSLMKAPDMTAALEGLGWTPCS